MRSGEFPAPWGGEVYLENSLTHSLKFPPVWVFLQDFQSINDKFVHRLVYWKLCEAK